MLKHRLWMYGGVFASQLVLSILLDDPIMAGIIVIGVFIPGYLFISLRRQRKRVSILDDACNPEAFIEATQRQLAITGKNKRFSNLLRLDLSAGLASAGRFEEAIMTLDGLDEKIIRKHQLGDHALTINRYVVLRGLERHEEADALFEESISTIQTQKWIVQEACNLARLDYDYQKRNFDACHELIRILEKEALKKRYLLSLSYTQGLLALAEGKPDIAKGYFERVVTDGATLHIARKAENCLMEI